MKLPQPHEHEGDDLSGWFWSVKVDGFRCFWSGQQFVSRSGEPFNAPQSWVDAMPDKPLDGELFAGSWSETASAVQSNKWELLRFFVFDTPARGSITERMASIPQLPIFCSVLQHHVVFSNQHALDLMRDECNNGGEGIVLRAPNSGYQYGTQIKLKPVMDAECEIISPVYGVYKTIAGSYESEWNGVRFRLPAHGKEFNPGDRVTFFYRGTTTAGKPRSPKPKGKRVCV